MSGLANRYVMYDNNGKRVGRVSKGHDGRFRTDDGWKNAKYHSLIPSHLTAEKDISDKKVSAVQSDDMKQFLARTDYDSVNKDSEDEWSFNCPLLRQSCDDITYNTTVSDEFKQEVKEKLREFILDDWDIETVYSAVDELIDSNSAEAVLKAITEEWGDDCDDETVMRTQWIFSPRGSSKDDDPHIYTSGLAYYKFKDFLPQWALEDISHQIGLDGHSQIQAYNMIQLEREMDDSEWESDSELYQYVTDKYRLKFTSIELEGIESDVEEKLENNSDLYDDLKAEYREEWAQVIGGNKDEYDTTWYNYNQSLEGQRFNSQLLGVVWIHALQKYWENVYDDTLEQIENGKINIVGDAVVSQAWDLLEDDEDNDDTELEAYIGKYNACVYREWWTKETVPPLSLYCAKCGEKTYEDTGSRHNFDYSLKLDCSECGFEMTPYNIISMPQNIDEDSLFNSPDVIENSLRAYWNRAIRYGFRLSDRIAVNLRAYEFEKYADELNIDWELRCPMYRESIDDIDNEGLTDVEFNHTRYENDSGNSKKQMAEGFTVSRSAHDVIHMNMTQYYFENHILGSYGEGDEIDVDWLEYQVYCLVNHEHHAYTDIYGSIEKDNPDFLSHIQTYYDLSEYDTDTLWDMYTTADEHIEEIEDRYELRYDDYCEWYVDRNDKNLNTAEQVDEFMTAKEERNKEYIQQLQETETEAYVGDEFALIHPLVAHYQSN